MTSPVRPSARRITALFATIALVLTATGCSGETGSGSATGAVTSITALDYYTDASEHAQWGERLTACGKTAGVTVEQRSVPGASLIPKVLQQASSRTLPDLLMLDNPDLQQIAQTGALTPLDQYGIDSSGLAKGILSASTPTRGRCTDWRPPSARSPSSTTRTCSPRPVSPCRGPGTSWRRRRPS